MKLIALLFLLTFSSCYTFYSSTGVKFHKLHLSNDEVLTFESDERIKNIKPFNSTEFNNFQTAVSISYRTITKYSIKTLEDSLSRFAIIFYNPKCKSSVNTIQKVSKIASKNKAVFLVSLSYNINSIEKCLWGTNLLNEPILILSAESYGRKMELKKLLFLKDICNDCYSKYRGDLLNAQAVIFTNGSYEILFHFDKEYVESKMD